MLVENYFFLEHLRGSRFLQCLFYQQLSIACYQVSFYANNYFEWLPIVSTTFNKACLQR